MYLSHSLSIDTIGIRQLLPQPMHIHTCLLRATRPRMIRFSSPPLFIPFVAPARTSPPPPLSCLGRRTTGRDYRPCPASTCAPLPTPFRTLLAPASTLSPPQHSCQTNYISAQCSYESVISVLLQSIGVFDAIKGSAAGLRASEKSGGSFLKALYLG